MELKLPVSQSIAQHTFESRTIRRSDINDEIAERYLHCAKASSSY